MLKQQPDRKGNLRKRKVSVEMTSATETKEGRQKVRPVNVFPETVRCFWRKRKCFERKQNPEKMNMRSFLLLSCKFAFTVRTTNIQRKPKL